MLQLRLEHPTNTAEAVRSTAPSEPLCCITDAEPLETTQRKLANGASVVVYEATNEGRETALVRRKINDNTHTK